MNKTVNKPYWVGFTETVYVAVACFQQIEFFMQYFFFGFNSLLVGKRNGEEHSSQIWKVSIFFSDVKTISSASTV